MVVDLISNNDEALGVVVPTPAAPVEGNVFCALMPALNKSNSKRAGNKIFVFIFMSFDLAGITTLKKGTIILY